MITDDALDVRLALGAGGLLREFNDIGVLSAADVHVAQRLVSLIGERDEAVALAAALAVRAPRLGHVYVDLATIRDTATVDSDEPVDLSVLPWPEAGAWLQAVRASRLVAVGEDDPENCPLRLVGSGLYLDRYWREERQVAADLKAIGAEATIDAPLLAAGLDRFFGPEDEGQREAAESAVRRRFAVVAGGPGTGKTTTVARIVALLAEQAGQMPLVALAAPTGKAAARLQEAVHARRRRLGVPRTARARGADAAPAARLAAGLAQPLPSPPRQPAAPRRRDRRRDLDGLAQPDGAGDRGGAAGGAARPRGRSGAADVDRGGRRARGHRQCRRARRRGARTRLSLRRGHRRARVGRPHR